MGRISPKTAIVVVATISLVVLPVVVAEFPVELSRWYLAAGLECSLEKDYPAAIRKLDKAIDLSPSDPHLYLHRARFKVEAMRWESGLHDCDAARLLAHDRHRVRALEAGLLDDVGVLRGQFLQHLNRHQEAVAQWKQLVANADGLHQGRMANRLNGLAYARALGGIELEEGLADVNEALETLGNRVVILDPAGYVYFGRGCTLLSTDQALALTSLNEAVKRAERVYDTNEKRAKALESGLRSPFRYEERLRVLRPHLAGILTVRASLLDEMERAQAAKRDRARIAKLAPNGNVSVAAPVKLERAIHRVVSAVSMLDTRGYLHLKLGDLSSARSDTEKAVEMDQWVETAYPWYIDSIRPMISDMRPLMILCEEQALTTAVIRYHRMLAYDALGMTDEANDDRRAIHASGFEPGDHLF